ncbi:iron chelate uptake ABC transporter family permease subunit [Streptococcus massiliensis]|uniref:Putative ABC transporter permease n=1 Tax=Streptococcus massiliensis TaxID=313439 RepID=A0A380KV61_9STRE|nr:iron chelate uptake ABC transporter family permease subunit [Streptococcus massiliensis]SUN75803.1 putative ABC transporter permease [Streptococcus massiliensis]
MPKIKPATRIWILGLIFLSILAVCFYFFLSKTPLTPYSLKLRSWKLVAYILVAVASSFATISFQTITENRFLTPSVLGLESFYVLLQSLYFFIAARFLGETIPALGQFILILSLLAFFFLLLQPVIKKLLKQGFVLILLICMTVATLFRSVSTFLQVLMDPNEYDKLQGRLFASFQRINTSILLLALPIILLAVVYLWRKNAILNAFHLDKETAQVLGIEVEKEQKRILWAIVLLTGTTTALVGPMMFFGFLIANLTYILVAEYQHRTLFIVASLLGFVSLLFGQMIVERVFRLQVSVSSVIELLGGLFFFYLLYQKARANQT